MNNQRSGAGGSTWRQLLRRGMAATLPRQRFLVRGPRGCGAVCLTFDDGPHPEHTPRLLDVLGELGTSATFFVIGERAEWHPDLIRRMAAEGHAIGGHSYYHTAPERTPARQLIEEVRRTRDLLAGLLGTPQDLFRPPHGRLTTRKLLGLWRLGQRVVLWNADPKDFARSGPDAVRAWFAEHPLRGGDLVLMHDNHPHAASVLPELVAEARGRGLSFSTVTPWVT